MDTLNGGRIETRAMARLVNRYLFSITVEEACTVTAQTLGALLPGDCGVLYLKDARMDLYHPAALWGSTEKPPGAMSGQDCWALRRNRMHKVMAGSDDVRCTHSLGASATVSTLCVPVLALGEPFGLLHYATQGDAVTFPDRRQAVGLVADLFALAIANIRLRDRIQELVECDYLTGLYNRSPAEEQLIRLLKTASRENTPVGLVMMDIDHFGYFTDNYGYQTAHAVLRDLSAFLKEYLHPDDVACKFGGDEFLLILPGNSLEAARTRAEHIRELLKDRAQFEGHRHMRRITLSIGVAAFPDHGKTAGDLIQSARHGVKLAKEGGRDRVAVA